MIDAVDAALQQAPMTLYRVRVDITINIVSDAMIDCVVRVIAFKATISRKLIGENL